MQRLIKKLILSILAAIVLTFSFVPYARAQGAWYNQSFPEWYLKVYDTTNPQEIFGERYTAAQVQWIFYTLFSAPFNLLGNVFGPELPNCILSGDVGPCFSKIFPSSSAPGATNTAHRKNFFQVLVEDRPLSGITYVKNIARKFHLIPEAKAQEGFGFGRLDPILPIWKTTRNFAYALFVLTAIIFSFMIMFRVKISPQTIITVQSALPKLVVAAILVTFSYAIAGFLVDLMYVFIGLVSLFFSPQDPVATFELLTKGILISGNLYSGIFGPFLVYLLAVLIVLAVVLFSELGLLGIFVAVGSLFVSAAFATGATGGGAIVIFGLLLILVFFVLLLLILWHFARAILMLIRAFANILLLTIFAPLQITLGTLIPSFGFGSWVKSLAGNLMVFPVTGFMIMLAFRFLGLALSTSFPQGEAIQNVLRIFIGAPLADASLGVTSAAWPPLLGGERLIPLIFVGVSVIIFSLIPKAADLIKSMVEGKPFAYGTAIGEVGAPIRAIGGLGPVRSYREAAARESAATFIGGPQAWLQKRGFQDLSETLGNIRDRLTSGRS
ncbi:hypothetical protein A3E46_00665 [Candidatus Woesebacteria bacterium RIFCSPHIGHO2_12_FULL_46_16]|uniref:Uncharacterized protein n=1 Tax=Candidatus Woesebacteria bacterium RIFCSPHIGHO2_12_FULL_46_16 TaxID=1802513 RepID=A0A1F8AX40_9BACT|nr:MAG: hypothetical protein A3E46_00665 [Candidatus Woesebacteria bacterium RIFCSPHIGHO2_12_FULL_46_16]